MILKYCMDHLGLKVYKVFINDDPELSLNFLRQGQILSKLLILLAHQLLGEGLQDQLVLCY